MAIFDRSPSCSNCASRAIRRSKRKRLLEQILHSTLFVSPYRCTVSDERYFRLRLPMRQVEKPPRHAA